MENIPTVNLKDYKKIKEIGKGSFGVVSIALKTSNSTEYAAKEYKTTLNKHNKDLDFFHEVISYSKVNNPAILELIGYSLNNFKNEEKPTIILEYMRNGSLAKILHNKSGTPLTRSQKYFILLGSAIAMKKLHSIGIIHRDLKTENILLDDCFLPKICDFGCSIISDKELTEFQMEDGAGTPIYMAPEIYSSLPYTYKVDVYSFAIVMYEVLTEITPFANYESRFKLMKDKKEGKIPDLSKIDNFYIKDLIERCLSTDSNSRLSFREIVAILMFDEVRQSFEVKEKSFSNYTKLFDADLINENMGGEFDYERVNDYDNKDAIKRMAINLFYGIGVEQDKEKAAHYFHWASQRGDSDSMFQYARMLQKGRGTKVDKELARKIYKSAAIVGNKDAIYNYAHMLYQGEGGKKDVEKAAHYSEFGANLGDTGCMDLYAYLLLNELSLYDPYNAGLNLFKAAIFNNPNAMLNYSNFLFKQNDDNRSQIIAVDYIKKAADAEHLNAMIRYGFLLWNGICIRKNKSLAKNYIKRAVDIGNNFTFRAFALVKSQDNDFTFDKEQIYEYFLVAVDRKKDDVFFNCEQYIAIEDWKIINLTYLARQVEILADNGNAKAKLYYGILKMLGIGTQIDIEESNRYFKMSAEDGNADGMYQYALSSNNEETNQYIIRSAENGNVKAMYKYAMDCYKKDNFSEAAKYFKMAADKEVRYEWKENIVLFQNILDKILEIICNGKTEDILGTMSNKYCFKGDDELIGYNVESIIISTKFFIEMLQNGKGFQFNLSDEKKYSYKFIRLNCSDLTLKYFLNCKINDLKVRIHNGDLKAMHTYALMLLNGDEVKIDLQEGFKYLKTAADKGNPESMIQYATMLFKGQNIETNREEAIHYFKKAADQGNIEALKIFGNLTFKRNYYECDPKEKIKYIQKLADIGDPDFLYEYGCILNKTNQEEAIKLFKKSAYKGNVLSMFKYGMMLIKGEGVVKNEKEGIHFIILSADLDNDEALLFLGKYIIKKNGYKIDKIEASQILKIAYIQENFNCIRKYFNITKREGEIEFTRKDGVDFILKSSEQVNTEAMLLYGIFLFKGYLVEKDQNKGIEYIKESACRGNTKAMYQYGKILLEKNESPDKIKEALEYLKRSADQGNENSMHLYGSIILDGNVIDKNKEDGIHYIKMAIEKGNEESMIKLGLLLYKDGQKEEASKYLKKAIDKGNAKAMFLHGKFLVQEGDVNSKEGFELIKKSIDKGSIDAMHFYGKLLIDENNIVEGIEYIKKAMDLGNINSTYLYGSLLLKYGVNENKKKEGFQYLRKAGENGNTEAFIKCIKKSINNLFESNNEIYIESAIITLKKLADMGDDESMIRYGIKLFNGEGTESNKEDAIKYIKMAAEKGNQLAIIIYETMFLNKNEYQYDKIDKFQCLKKEADNGNIVSMVIYAEFVYCGTDTTINYKEAVKYFKMAADKGDINAMLNYGIMLFKGQGVEFNKKESLAYIKMAAEKGCLTAMVYYGKILISEIDTNRNINIKEISNYFKMAADKGDSEAMYLYGMMFLNGIDMSINLMDAIHYIRKSADSGFDEAMNYMGHFLWKGNINIKDSIRYFKVSSEFGNIGSCYQYGKMLFEGNGIEMNKKEGIKHIKNAADNGNNDALVDIAIILHDGNGIEPNIKEAEEYFQKAIENGCIIKLKNQNDSRLSSLLKTYKLKDQNSNMNDNDDDYEYEENYEEEAKKMKIEADNGNPNSMLRYGIMLKEGEGVEVNKKEAARYLKMAADHFISYAMHLYAFMRYKGDGIEMDKKEAAHYFKLAADMRHIDSCYFYGKMLSEGDGIKANKKKAEKYFRMINE